MIRLSYNYILLSILLVGSSIQLGEYSINRVLIPTVSAVLCLGLIFISGSLNYYLICKKTLLINLVTPILLILIVGVGAPNIYEVAFGAIKISLPFIYSICIITLIRNIDSESLEKVFRLLCVFVVSILLFEFLFRASNASSINQILVNFYLFKTNSPFFNDTNATALYAICYFMPIYYYNYHYKNESNKFITICLYIMLLMVFFTLSRAAIISLSLFITLSLLNRGHKNIRVLLFFIGSFSSLLIIPLILDAISSDGSGQTKIEIFSALPNIITTYSSLDILFGFGFDYGSYAYSYEVGKYSHLLITMLLGQVGLIGALIYFIYFILLRISSSKDLSLVIIPLFIVGLSYLSPFLENIFIATSIIYILAILRSHNGKK